MQWFSGKSFQLIKKQGSALEHEFAERISGYILGAFGLVAGLAWNDAIKSLIEFIFPLKQDPISAKFLYAIIITVVIVILTLYVMRLIKRSPK